MTFEDALNKIFPAGLIGRPATFALDSDSSFEDTHGLSIANPGNPFPIFKEETVLNEKVGYFLEQEYYNSENELIGTAEISRRLKKESGPSNSYSYFIKKIHMFCE